MMQKRRWHWLSGMATTYQWKLGIEIGVLYGQNIIYLLRHNPNLTMVGIDAWLATEEYTDQIQMDEYKESAYLINEIYPNRCWLFQSSSDLAHMFIPNGIMDFVFIDADHSYLQVVRDIMHYTPKIKSGGFLCGHDINRLSVQKAIERTIGLKRIHRETDGVWFIERNGIYGN